MAADTSVRMLSPPLSPYPDLSSFGSSLKLRASSPPSVLDTQNKGDVDSPDREPIDAASAGKRKMVTCWDSMLASPSKYLKKERSYLDLYPVHPTSWSNYMYVEAASEKRMRRRPRTRVRRILSELEGSGMDLVLTRSRASSVGADRPTDRSSEDDSSATPRPRGSSKKRSSVASPVRVHDLNFAQIDDFSPSTSILPPGRSLRAEWKGAPMDLSQDPDGHLLHPAELHLASVLRLPAEVYIDSKRRLFAEKVHRMRQGLPFRRTDSQKACRIDVNKASRLFGAFEKVGWLEDHLFTKYL